MLHTYCLRATGIAVKTIHSAPASPRWRQPKHRLQKMEDHKWNTPHGKNGTTPFLTNKRTKCSKKAVAKLKNKKENVQEARKRLQRKAESTNGNTEITKTD